VPSLLWLAHPHYDDLDSLLDGLAITGGLLSLLVTLTGAANMMVMTALWILYFSLVSVGQNWFSFGWESQLLETGFLAIWSVPLWSWSQMPSRLPSPKVCVYGYRWLIFRIMLGAGLIKIRGDPCWRQLTCMNYFYNTQPNPNPVAYFAHQAPHSWHAFETIGNHMIELVFPWCTFIPLRAARLFNGCWQIIFQLVLISTGNLSFLNWLTIAPSIWYFDDKFLSFAFSKSTLEEVREKNKITEKEMDDGWSDGYYREMRNLTKNMNLRNIVNLSVGCLIAYLSVPIVANLASSSQAMNRSFDPFRIVNTYGAFGSVTKERTEVVIEGSDYSDLENPKWLEYEFKCKPGSVTRAPCLISPYHYRLDWLMWFTAFQNYQSNPWLLHLMGKMLENDPIVDSLISKNPFRGKKPPVRIRARHYKYTFTKISGKAAAKGQWWSRKLIGEYVPEVDLETLRGVYKQFGWKMAQDK